MPLLRLDNAALHYGPLVLLDHIDLSISRGRKIGLLGRNGAGKTTLLKVLAGEIALDTGERWVRPGTRIAWLQQSLPEADRILAAIARWGAQQGRVVPVYFIGVGETMDDLQTFSALEFAQALVA